MANKKAKVATNVNGKFYVDDQCIACDNCAVEAPRFFAMNDKDGYAYVQLQPKSESETEECLRALEACPVEAIGHDGDDS
jgi:ferredoxin